MRWKLYLSLVLLCLVLTFVLQNTDRVSFNFLFWSFGLPRALLLLVVFLCGVAAGLLWVAGRRGALDKARAGTQNTAKITKSGGKERIDG